MLVLSRNLGQRILIGGNIAVTIVRIGPHTVRLGIDAPPWMTIDREELAAKKAANVPDDADDAPAPLTGSQPFRPDLTSHAEQETTGPVPAPAEIPY